MDNYEVSKLRAQKFFLGFDQEKIIRDWSLEYDENYLYTTFFGQSYRVARFTGVVEKSQNHFHIVCEAGYDEVLSIFDFFCHESNGKCLSGVWAPVNSLKGAPPTIGVGTEFHEKESQIFDQNIELFQQVCESLGGKKVPYGDVGYEFSVFGEFSVILKFYESDDEFPAQTTILWDENALQFLYYETTFYVAGHILRAIAEGMIAEMS